MTHSKMERISITQVAQAANVSIQTVSRVINEQTGVSLATRERILKVIEDMGYFPSRAAKAMRGSSKTLGIVGYGLELYGPSQTLVGAQQEARKNNYGVVLEILSTDAEGDLQSVIETMLSNHVDGIVWSTPHIGSNIENVIEHAKKITVPILFTDGFSNIHDLTVVNDNYLGGKLATQHLIDLGHRSIGLITGPSSYFSSRERHRGWRAAMQEAHLPCDDSWIVEGDWSAASGAGGLKTLEHNHGDVTAIFACNDQMALGVLYEAKQRGLDIPHDLAVIGYDDIPEAAFFHPGLSSVRQDLTGLGASAVSQLIQAVEFLAIRGQYTSETKILRPDLIIRGSTRPG